MKHNTDRSRNPVLATLQPERKNAWKKTTKDTKDQEKKYSEELYELVPTEGVVQKGLLLCIEGVYGQTSQPELETRVRMHGEGEEEAAA